MSIFTNRSFDGHEGIVFCSDRKTSLRAIIAIHNTNLGSALGGSRFWPYVSEADAIKDVMRLSKGMTYKAAMAGLNLGGGKAVILGDPKKIKTPELLHAYGRKVNDLNGKFITAEDVGTTIKDMIEIGKFTNYVRGQDEKLDPSIMTAEGVFAGIKAALLFKEGKESLKDVHIVIQGMGSVGFKLAKLLYNEGAKLTIADVYLPNIEAVLKIIKADVVDPSDVFDIKADVFAPCAMGAIINDDTIGSLKYKIVAGSANNQLATEHHGKDLMKKGILYAPDYVINAGGLISVSNEGPNFDKDKVLAQTRNIGSTLMEVFKESEAEKLPTSVVSNHIAERRFMKV